MTQKLRHIAELISDRAADHPGFPVLTFVDIGENGDLIDETLDFKTLYDNASRLATWIQKSGIQPGQRITFMLQNHPEFVEAMVAAALTGTIFVPLDPRSRGEKLAYMINSVESPLIIAGEYALDALAQVSGALDLRPDILVIDASIQECAKLGDRHGLAIQSYAECLAEIDPAAMRSAVIDPDAAMFMMFTSGTTGLPKAVQRSHSSYMRGYRGLEALGVQPQDTIYTGLPLCHINAQATLMMALSMPQRGVFSRRFTKSRLWDICRKYDCNVFTLLGGMIPETFSVPASNNDADNPVRLVITSGMPAELWNKFRDRFNVEISEVYGSTEGGGTLINAMGAGPIGSIGRTFPGQVAAVLDENDVECPPDKPGEICFRPEHGAPEAVTYFRNSDASHKKVHSGWYRSGDIGHMDKDGWFYFHYRRGGGIRRNGDFVNPASVEGVLVQHPHVLDAYVYGFASEDTVAGEKKVVAALVMDDAGTLENVQRWCLEQLQKNEIPEIWQPLPTIPKTVSEKPIERECIRLLQEASNIEEIA